MARPAGRGAKSVAVRDPTGDHSGAPFPDRMLLPLCPAEVAADTVPAAYALDGMSLMQLHSRILRRGTSELRRRRALAGAGAFALALTMLALSPAGALLPGSPSNFQSNDGDMVASGGQSDWASVTANAAYFHASDPTDGTDDSFEPGTKQDAACPNVVAHSNPPKDDFSDVSSFAEIAGGGAVYLYGATIRTAPNGNASENIELKQGLSGICPGSNLLMRSAGDKLIAIDYLNGGVNVQFNVLTWVTSGPCYVSGDPNPCWGATVQTLSANGAEGKVNQSNITAANNPISGQAIKAGQFAEFGVNLQVAGIIPAGSCKAFPQTVWESRASGASFVSSTKDVTIENKTISNCGGITIHKVTENDDSTFDYSTTGTGLSPFDLKNGEQQGFSDLNAGSYTVTEAISAAQSSDGWSLKSISCTSSAGSSTLTDPANKVTITLGTGGTVDCTFTNHKQFSPSISTILKGPGVASGTHLTGSSGDSFYDTSTLTGATLNAGGTVTYSVYSNNTCTGTPVASSTKNVTNGSVADSDPVKLNDAGTYYWQAVYGGDANNNTATSACSDETVLVKNGPSIATKLNGDQPSISVPVGSSVHDTATLTGATADVGGTVTYKAYSDSACSTGARDAGTKPVASGIVTQSDSLEFNSAGTFYWQAVYSGDAKNEGATSDCTSEVLTVTPKNPTGSTAQNLLPNDTFTLTGGFNATGDVTFQLFDPSDTICSGEPAYTQTVPLSGGTTAATTNTTFLATDVGTWRWVIVYAGDNNNNGVTLACGVEQFTIAND